MGWAMIKCKLSESQISCMEELNMEILLKKLSVVPSKCINFLEMDFHRPPKASR